MDRKSGSVVDNHRKCILIIAKWTSNEGIYIIKSSVQPWIHFGWKYLKHCTWDQDVFYANPLVSQGCHNKLQQTLWNIKTDSSRI